MWLNSKDGYKLSPKQYGVLLHHFDFEYDIADQYVMNHNYEEISKTIDKALRDKKPYYNEHYEDFGDR